MSKPNDVWSPPESDAPAPAPSPGVPPEGGSTDPVDVFRAMWADLSAHPVPYLLANLGGMAISTGFTLLMLALMGAAVAPGVALNDDSVLTLGIVAGAVIYLFGILALIFVVGPPMTASMLRGLDRQRRGEGTLGFTSSVNDATARVGAVIGTNAITTLLTLLGAFFFYLPGLVAMAVGSFALPIAVFEDVGPWQAWRLAWAHVRENPAWHAAVFALFFATLMALEFSVVGLLFVWPVMTAWQLYTYRLAYGEGGALGANPDR